MKNLLLKKKKKLNQNQRKMRKKRKKKKEKKKKEKKLTRKNPQLNLPKKNKKKKNKNHNMKLIKSKRKENHKWNSPNPIFIHMIKNIWKKCYQLKLHKKIMIYMFKTYKTEEILLKVIFIHGEIKLMVKKKIISKLTKFHIYKICYHNKKLG